jgi:hypothetical protein
MSKKKHLSTPIVVADRGWGQDIPEWLTKEIQTERMILSMLSLQKELADYEKVGDAEVVAYLMTASLAHPLTHEYTQIYLYIAAKVMIGCKRSTLEALPQASREVYERGLTEWEKKLLLDLKHDLYRKRGGEYQHPLIAALMSLK